MTSCSTEVPLVRFARRPVFAFALALVATLVHLVARADGREYIEVSGADFKPLPLAIAPVSGPESAVDTFTKTLKSDLQISGLFNLLDPKSFLADPKEGTTVSAVDFKKWRDVGADSLVKGAFTASASSLKVDLWLFDCVQGTLALQALEAGGPADAALMAHRWANRLYEYFTKEKGIFLTRIAFVHKGASGKEIWMADFDGHNAVSLTPGGGLNLLPGWSRNGKDVAFTSYRDGSPMLYAVNASSHGVTHFPERGELETGATYSPDGRHIAFTMSEHGNSDIYVMNTDGSGLRQLTDSREIDTSPTWSPDGKRIAFVSTRSGNPQIFTMNADGSSVQRLTLLGHYNQTPCWSPRGDVIAFTARDERNVFDIFTVDVVSRKITRLTQDAGHNEHPSFSPNGRYIVFVSTRAGGSRLFVMAADGSNQQPLDLKIDATSPSWGPWTD